MSERYEDPQPSAGRAMSTGEFRAAPDVSASTAQFRAFAESTADPVSSWDTSEAGRNVSRMALIVVGAVVLVALVVILIVTLA
jgi:hypothetical protein